VHSLREWGDLYEDIAMNLTEIAATMPLSVDQHEHVANSRKVMAAAQDRLRGDSRPLVNIIQELEANPESRCDSAVFGGLSFRKAAEALKVSLSSVQRAMKST
jgi:hypothetical protein